jgi:O-antigen/teichoic acid export membrane protein
VSRILNAARSLASGYAAIGVNVLYTLGSVPLALHYLSKAEFGLWATVTQVASYLLLIDMGMSASISRILMDHKDRPTDPRYGSVIQTGWLVTVVQGTCMALGGVALSFWLPGLMHIEPEFVRSFRLLVGAQCILIGIFFTGRIFIGLLQAHHRFDLLNHSQMAQLTVSFAVQWLTFHRGWGVYSLLGASFAGFVVGFVNNMISVLRLHLLPSRGYWGKPSRSVFKELFNFAGELMLLLIGLQLLNASQIIVISRTLGLSAAAVWAIANKAFPVAFQCVSRIFDFSASALGELHIRGEHEKLQRRYSDVLSLTASAAIFSGATLAVCNSNFLMLWTKGAIAWPRRNDLLLGLLLALTCVTRCPIGLSGYLKKIGGMKWINFLEGAFFIVGSLIVARYWGMTGILIVSLLANVVWTGSYGLHRTAEFFAVTKVRVIGWLKAAGAYALLMAPIVGLLWWTASRMPPFWGLVVNSGAMATVGLGLLWLVGLTPGVRVEIKSILQRFWIRKES